MKTYKFILKPITNIHIGSGQELDPTEYIITNGKLYYINQFEMIKYLKAKFPNEFDNLLNTADLAKIIDFFIEKFDEKNRLLWSSAYQVSDDFAHKYQERLHNPQSENPLYQFIRNGLNNSPYIPGSSLKGAIRTAVLDFLIQKDSRLKTIYKDRILQAKTLRYLGDNNKPDIKKDPFKYLRIADIHFPAEFINVKELKNIKKPENSSPKRPYSFEEFKKMKAAGTLPTKNAQSGISMFVETLLPNYALTGFLRINEKQFQEQTRISFADFPKIINDFHLKKAEKDKEFYAAINLGKEYHKLLQNLRNLSSREFVLKLGKGSGKKFITYSFKNYEPKTRNLIDNLPMGWCKITLNQN